MCVGYAAFCQITLTTCLSSWLIVVTSSEVVECCWLFGDEYVTWLSGVVDVTRLSGVVDVDVTWLSHVVDEGRAA